MQVAAKLLEEKVMRSPRVTVRRTIGVIALAVGSIFGLVGTSFSSASDPVAPVPAPACPANWSCLDMPNNGGQLQVGPTQHVLPVGGNQPWVFLRGYGFNPGDVVRVNYCSLVNGLTTVPLCAITTAGVFNVTPTVTLRVLPNGTIAESTQVPLNPSSNGNPFTAVEPGVGVQGTFYCDGGAASCGLVVTDGNLAHPYTNAPSNANSVAVPINYDLNSVACPSKQTLVPTESEFGIGPVLPVVNRLNCAGAHATNVFNTEQNGVTAMHDLYYNVTSNSPSAIRIAFTNDPEAPDQQKYLPKGHFVAIPIALTATVVGFTGQYWYGSTSYPQTQFNLSPNMAAGIFSGLYTGPNPTSDPTSCAGGCTAPPCVLTDQCSLLQLATPHDGFFTAKAFGAYPLSVQSGMTDQFLQWVCQSPQGVVPWGADQASKETMSAADALLLGLKNGGHAETTCPSTDQWPAETIAGANWSAGVSPQDQMKALNQFLAPIGVGSGANTGFAYMPWAWASYLGLNNAGLMNAANTFQTPSKDSLYAALNDATVNPDGTYSFSYTNTSDKAAYPMASVIYAVVSTDTMPADRKASIQTALSSILNVTGGAASSQLPDGYVPLPDSLVKQATTEINTAVGNPSFSIGSIFPQFATAGSSSPSFGGSGFGSSSFGGFSNQFGLHSGLASNGGKGGSAGNTVAPIPSSSPLYGALMLTANRSGMLIPWMAILGALVMLAGILLFGWDSLASLTRKIRKSPTVDGEPEAMQEGL